MKITARPLILRPRAATRTDAPVNFPQPVRSRATPQLLPVMSLLCWLLLLLFSTTVRAQPLMTVSGSRERIRAGDSFNLEVEVRWTGAPERYVLYPPKLSLPEGIEHGPLRQHFETIGGQTIYTYDYSLLANTAGTYNLGTVTLDYRDMTNESGQSGSASRSEPIVEQAPAITVQPGGLRGMLGQLLVLLLIVLAVGAALLLRLRRLTPRPSPPPGLPGETPGLLVQQARAFLMEGQNDRVYEVLIRLKPLLKSAEDPLPSLEQLEAERLRVRYGGVAGAREELERLLRSAEHLLKPVA